MPSLAIRHWSGSLVTAKDQEQTSPGDFLVLENFIFDEQGLPVTRGGRRKWNQTALTESGVNVPFRGLVHYRKGWLNARQDDWVVAYAGTQIVKSEQDATWDQIYSGLESGLRCSWATLRGWLIFASDSQKQPRLLFWDGIASTMRPLTRAPYGYIVAAHAGRLWIVDRDYPSRLWYSAPFEPDTWPGSNFGNLSSGSLAVEPGDGNAISALVPGYAGEMIIFKDGPNGGATYRLQGLSQEDFAITPLSSTLGAVSQSCVSLIGDRDILFGSRRGVHSLRRTFEHGDLESSFIDVDVADRWRALNDKQKAQAVAVDDFVHDTWWLFYDTNSDGVNDHGLLFNYRHRTADDNPRVSEVSHGASAASMFRDRKLGRDRLLTGQSGYTYTEGNPEATDDGVAFTWTAQLAPLDGGDALGVKSWEDLWLVYDNWGEQTATLTWFGDNRTLSTDTLSLNPAQNPVPFYGAQRLNETNLPQSFQRGSSCHHLREGGTALSLALSGSGSRFRFRGLKLNFTGGRPDVAAWSMMPFDQARDSLTYGG